MKRIICHGDSLTEGADIEKAFRWPSLLQNSINVEVINTGIGGDTTAGLLSRFLTDVVTRKPDLVILMAGTNDFWWDLPVNTVMANLFSMAYQAQHYEIAPMFGMPTPFIADQALKQPYSPPEAGYDRLVSKLTSMRQKLKAAAQESEIPVLDFYRMFSEGDDRIRTHLFLEDGLHANRQGHRLMAELAVSEIKKLFLLG
jgi:lysophospholipase L1-like esterase